jgi:hypothetical protein
MRTISNDQPSFVMHAHPAGPVVVDISIFQQQEGRSDSSSSFDVRPTKTPCCPTETPTTSPCPLLLSPSPIVSAIKTVPRTSSLTTPPLALLFKKEKEEKPKKQVIFNDENDHVIHAVPHRSEYSKEERNEIWYSPKEYKRLRKEGQDTVKRIRNGEKLLHVADLNEDEQDDQEKEGNDSVCWLGLDSETHAYAKLRSLHKMLLQNVLDDEQKRQYYLGIYDAEAIAAKVSAFVTRCQHAKFVAGLRDDRTQRRGVIN